jgi:hypothetical protein
VFETLDTGAPAVASDDAAAIVDAGDEDAAKACIEDPDASGDPRACSPGCKGVVRGHSYMICNVEASWAAAEADCESHGLKLVRVDNADENNWLHDIAFRSSPGIDRNWLGGSDLSGVGDWRWADGTKFWSGLASGSAVNGLYNNWSTGEPNNMGDVEHCVVMFFVSTWNDDDCATPHRYVCESQ